MLAVEAKPLLSEQFSTGSEENESTSSEVAASGAKRGRSGSTMRLMQKQSSGDSTHSYTDLHLLTKAAAPVENGPNRNALGTINGVYVPCLLNIIGVILFLRLGWGIGQAGVEGMLLIFFMAEAQAILTVLSVSTITSNGSMQGGGSYFLISRSLGPECGGAIGIQFYFLYAVGVSMYLVGFAEEAEQTWFSNARIGERWVIVLIATAALIMIVAIAIVGAHAFARVNRYLFLIQFVCVAVGAFFIFVVSPHELKSGGKFTGPQMKVLMDNFPEHYTAEQHVCSDTNPCTFAGVYAIVFPLATGFMEGLNLSGDLKHPGKSIPMGTLAAVGTACIVYISLIFTFASAFPSETLRNNFSFFQEVSDYPFVVIIGVLVSCFSSALGALFGASRILQAIARDDLFPTLKIVSQGSPNGDEPQHAVLFTALLTQFFICLGDLDVIAPICTSFFCLAYAGVNFTCFLLQVTGVPNFRPTFRYHSWHLSLLGTVLNIGVMIYLDAVYAAVSLLLLSVIFFYLYFTVTPKEWGDISQALIYHQVRKFLLRLDTRKAHSKFWRPAILLLTDEIDCAEVKLSHNLKKGGLYIVGNVIKGEFGLSNNSKCGEKYNQWLGHIFDSKLKAIPQVVVASQVREGYRMLMQTSGLGGMQINTIVIPWLSTTVLNPTKTERTAAKCLLDLQSPLEYVGLLIDGIILKKNIVVLRHTDRLDSRLFHQSHRIGVIDKQLLLIDDQRDYETIDVWITCKWDDASVDTSAALMLQLAYVLYSNKQWRRRTKIRLIKLCDTTDSNLLHRERQRLQQLAERLRIAIHVHEMLVIPSNPSSILAANTKLLPASGSASCYFNCAESVIALNQTLQRNAARTAQLILMLPDPRQYVNDEQQSNEYLTRLELLTNNLPSTMLVFNDDDASVISTCI